MKEYIKQKYGEEKPTEYPELTPKEKWANWWHYNYWIVLCAAFVLVFLGDILWNALTAVKPDLSIAYVSRTQLSEEDVVSIETALETLCYDMNGDGKVKVTLDQFYFPEMSGETDQVSYNTRMSSEARLCADISENISFLFIMDDPALVQAITGALSYPDGTLPDDDDVTAEGKYLQWQDCPELASLGLDEYFSSMYIARRGFWRTETVPNADLCQELWNEWRE